MRTPLLFILLMAISTPWADTASFQISTEALTILPPPSSMDLVNAFASCGG